MERVFTEIRADDRALWIGGGDYCEFIQRNDPRFEPGGLARWFGMQHMGDICGAEKGRFLKIIEGSESKCLGLLSGNHETAIKKHYERDIYSEIVHDVKKAGGFAPDYPLAMGYSGYFQLVFKRGTSSNIIAIFVHHGFGGGRKQGGKANRMVDLMSARPDAQLVIMGHDHGAEDLVVPNTHERLRRNGKLERVPQRGVYAGSFSYRMQTEESWGERMGFSLTTGKRPQITIRPFAERVADRIRVTV